MMLSKYFLKYMNTQPGHALTKDTPHQTGTNMSLNVLEDVVKGNVLDIGCGDGWTCLEMEKRFPVKATGITISREDVETGQSLGVRIVQAEMHHLPVRSKFFDLLWVRHSFEHSFAPFIFLCECNRVLKNDGFMFMATPVECWIEADPHYSVLNRRQMKEMLRKTRFGLKKYWGRGEHCYLVQKKGNII